MSHALKWYIPGAVVAMVLGCGGNGGGAGEVLDGRAGDLLPVSRTDVPDVPTGVQESVSAPDCGPWGRTDAGTCSDDGVEVAVGASGALALEFWFREELLTSLKSKGGSALYLLKGATRIDLIGPFQSGETAAGTVLTGMTEDGRAVTVTIWPGPQGAARIRLDVEGKEDDELLCADFSVSADEGFYGLMERVVDGPQDKSWTPGMEEGLNLRGQEVLMFVTPTVSLFSPFLVSSAGYGIFVESDWPGTWHVADSDPGVVSVEYEGESLTLHLFPGPGPLDATARYARAVGLPLMPPRWAFGHWRWRDEVWDLPAFYDGTPYDGPYNSMIVEDILMMEALGIPCSVYWIDRPWAEGGFGYDDFDWDEDRLPDPPGMLAWLAKRDVKLLLWIAPWAVGKMADEAVSKGYNVAPEFPFAPPPEARLLDLTNPEVVTWWQDHLIPVIEQGVVGFKLDRGDEKVPDGLTAQGFYADGTPFRAGRNPFPRLYAAAVHGAFERAGADEFIVMPRAGWVGSSQHAVFWGGDTGPGEWGLRSAIIAVQRASAMNFPIWGSDTCGYAHLSGHEVCARWVAFSAFTPLMEVGPTDNVAFWSVGGDVSSSGYGGNPYYDAELLAVWNLYANLHTDLIDYMSLFTIPYLNRGR